MLFLIFSGDAKYTFPPGKEPVGKAHSSRGKKLQLIILRTFLVENNMFYWLWSNWCVLSFSDSENGYDVKESQSSADDLFSRKSDEYNFFRNDNLDPSKQRLSHIAMLLEKLVSINFFCKFEQKIEVTFSYLPY